MLTTGEKNGLEARALAMRRDVVSSIYWAGSGHPGGSLSAVDVICALYFKLMRIRPAEPQWEDRDRFVLSKGHSAPALYAAAWARRYWSACLRGILYLQPLQGYLTALESLAAGMSCWRIFGWIIRGYLHAQKKSSAAGTDGVRRWRS